MEPVTDAAVTLEPFCEARSRFAHRPLHVRTLAPTAPALGVGVLRVLRVAERPDGLELVVGYERYERLRASKR